MEADIEIDERKLKEALQKVSEAQQEAVETDERKRKYNSFAVSCSTALSAPCRVTCAAFVPIVGFNACRIAHTHAAAVDIYTRCVSLRSARHAVESCAAGPVLCVHSWWLIS